MRWLHRLGLFEDDQKKGAFFDGHERNDNLCARHVFLDAFVVLARRMNCFENVFKETVIPPVLTEGARRLVWITHDESTFNPLDIYGKRKVFREKGKVIQKMKRGAVQIMVTDFITAETGRLLGTPRSLPPVPTDAEQASDKRTLTERAREL
jgi:hypothetical protein